MWWWRHFSDSASFPSRRPEGVTTSPDVYISIHVTLTDSKVIVSPKTAPRGADARFIVRNVGTKVHNFTVRTGSLTGFSRVFKPGEHAILPALPLVSRHPALLQRRNVRRHAEGDEGDIDRRPGMRGVHPGLASSRPFREAVSVFLDG